MLLFNEMMSLRNYFLPFLKKTKAQGKSHKDVKKVKKQENIEIAEKQARTRDKIDDHKLVKYSPVFQLVEEVFDLELDLEFKQSYRNESAYQRRRRTSTVKCLQFKHEDIMEYAVDCYMWKLSLETRSRPAAYDLEKAGVSKSLRRKLTQWMVGVARKLDYSLETLCLAVNYLDRFLRIQPLEDECLELVGMTSLMIAAKVEEVKPAKISKCLRLCSYSYTYTHFKHMEIIMLSKLRFELMAPTVAFALNLLVEIQQERDWPHHFARHLVEMCLCDDDIPKLLQTEVGQAIFMTLKTLKRARLMEACAHCPRCSEGPHIDESRDIFNSCFKKLKATLLQKDRLK